MAKSKHKFHPARQRWRMAGRDWPQFSGFYTPSIELATMALILARRNLEALGYDPERLILHTAKRSDGGPLHGLQWMGRTIHPHTGVRASCMLLVDWSTLELLE